MIFYGTDVSPFSHITKFCCYFLANTLDFENTGYTALGQAILKNHINVVRFLIAKGADVNMPFRKE